MKGPQTIDFVLRGRVDGVEITPATIGRLSFEDYAPHYDEDALDRFASAGRYAWVDVSDPSRWVEELRGAS
ncbi:MAG: hypothetical protein WCP45_08915 [Verrucomicrobiota bacterium]|jgi:hypothetical protein